MKALAVALFLSMGVTGLLAQAPAEPDQGLPTLVVFPFANSTTVAQAGVMAADVFIRELFQTGRFQLITPTKTLPILVREKLGSVDVDEWEIGTRLGNELGADYALLGAVTAPPAVGGEQEERKRPARPNRIELSARLVNIHPGATLWMCSRSVSRFGGLNTQETLRGYAREMTRLMFEELDAKLPPYAPAECVALDLSAVCNTGFRDDQKEDRQGGWTDDGPNDLRTFPTGQQTFCGVKFNILDPAQNDWKSCLILRGKDRPYFPPESEAIPVGQALKAVYFLHTAAWCAPDGTEVLRYVITFEDETTAEVPVIAGSGIGDWWNATPLPNARLAWKGDSQYHDPDGLLKYVGVYLYRWSSPSPEKVIKTIKAISAGRATPIVIAITGEK